MTDHFYITLPANTANFDFENSSANFKVKLPKFIQLSDSWQVGLAEISYTYRWYNIEHDETIKLKYFNKENRDMKQSYIPKGYYKIDKLLATLNRVMDLMAINEMESPHFDMIRKNYDKRVYIDFGKYFNTVVFPELSKNLCYILGINKPNLDNLADRELIDYERKSKSKEKSDHIILWQSKPISEEKLSYIATNTYDISGGIHTIFIYCDIIKPYFVGDSKTQLLRLVEIPNRLNYGDQVHICYDEIQYHYLLTKEFDSIEIDVKDDTGRNIPFTHAQNVIVLHFKKLI